MGVCCAGRPARSQGQRRTALRQARQCPPPARRLTWAWGVGALSLVALAGCTLAGARIGAPERFACARAATATIERRGPDRLFYCGPLNPADARRFIEALRPHDATLDIVSYGGELDGPLTIAERVQTQGMTVRVLGPCFSGCASFVFPAARARSVEPGGMLGFHNTATSILEALDSWPVALLTDAEKVPLEARSAREKALYARSGVRADLLSDPLRRIGVTCLVRAGYHRDTAEPIILVLTRWGVWSPSARQLSAYGVETSGRLSAMLAPALTKTAAVPAALAAHASVILVDDPTGPASNTGAPVTRPPACAPGSPLG